MKRFYLSLAIFALLLGLSCYSLYLLNGIRTEMDELLIDIITAAELGDKARAGELVDTLSEYWPEKEDSLIRFLRHSDLDSITGSVAKLPYLLKYDNTAEFLAEVNHIKTLLAHMWETEIPTLHNIL